MQLAEPGNYFKPGEQHPFSSLVWTKLFRLTEEGNLVTQTVFCKL